MKRQRFFAALAISCGVAFAAPSTGMAVDPSNTRATTVHLGMNVDHRSFLRYRGSWHGKYGYDWTTDGCSTPGFLNGLSWVKRGKRLFPQACLQHDFCYRNGKKFFLTPRQRSLNVWNKHPLRKRCDDRFRIEMRRICNGRYPTTPAYNLIARRGCHGTAGKWYVGVRQKGR